MQETLHIMFEKNDAYMQGIFLHEMFACLFFVPYISYLIILYRAETFLTMNKKIYFVMPITVFLLGVGLITGIFLLSMRCFIIDIRILFMILVLLLFIVGEIYRIKTLKKATTSLEGMQRYRYICKIMYLFFIAVLFCIIGFIKIYKG